MIDYIIGKTVTASGGTVVLEVGTLGIELQVPDSLCRSLHPGATSKLFTVLSIKNEELKLFGFGSTEERAMFKKLQNVSGIGPAVAMNILSNASLATLYQAIVQEDLALFKHIKGVGKKTAQRIVLELKGSLQKEGMPDISSPFPTNSSLQSDAIAALLALGYAHDDSLQAANKAWEKIGDRAPKLDQLVREALEQL